MSSSGRVFAICILIGGAMSTTVAITGALRFEKKIWQSCWPDRHAPSLFVAALKSRRPGKRRLYRWVAHPGRCLVLPFIPQDERSHFVSRRTETRNMHRRSNATG